MMGSRNFTGCLEGGVSRYEVCPDIVRGLRSDEKTIARRRVTRQRCRSPEPVVRPGKQIASKPREDTLAIWVLRESSETKGWFYKGPGDRQERSLGEVSAEIATPLLKEWVVARARPGDVIVMEGREWVMSPAIGLRIEVQTGGGLEREVVTPLKADRPI